MAKRVTAKRETRKRSKAAEPRLDSMPVYQIEKHTCGLCACSAVYKFFKVSRRGLRKRLGVDRPIIPPFRIPLRNALPEWLITPYTKAHDMCEVLWEDGVDFETTADYGKFLGMMPIILDMGYPALVVVEGLTHWIVVSGIDDDNIFIVDSRRKKPFWKSIEKFRKAFNCAIMITGHGISRKPGLKDYTRNYLAGIKMVAIATGKKMTITQRSLKIEKKRYC